MKQQVLALAASLTGREPTRGDIIELLKLIKDENEEDRGQWLNLFVTQTSRKPEKIIADIDSYSEWH